MTRNKVSQKNKKIRVRQVGSGIRRDYRQRRVLKGLGLGRVGKVRTLEDSPAIRGMCRKIAHLVRVEEES